MSAAQKTEAVASNLAIIDAQQAFAAEFNALLDDIEFVVIPAVVYPERDFSDFTL